MEIQASGLDDAYRCVAVVYQIPDEFDCILGIPFFEDMQPQIDWRSRQIEGTRTKTLHWKRAGETCKPIEEGGPVITSGLRRSVEAKGLSAKRPDSCRGAALETDVKLTIETVADAVQKEKTSRAVRGQQEGAQAGKGSAGTKFITRTKLRKFLRIKTKKIDEPDFMLVLLNETIKQVARSLQRRDEPDNVGSAKAQRYLETDWDTFRENPAFDLLTEYKDNVFRPELPEGLPEKRELEHRIDVKDPNLAMYRQQWRQSPEQQREIVKWVEDMAQKKLIRPSISRHAAPTFCVRKPVGWRIVHDYRYLNSYTVRQSIPMTRKEDILDAMSGANWFSAMDLMSAYYRVRMREEDIKFTAFQAPNGLWEYLVLPMGVCNAPATMHRLTSKLFRDLKNTKSFYDDIYIFTKSPNVEDHLDALRETLDILCDNKLYVKLSKCVFCADEIPCLGDFVGRNGVRMDPDKVQTIKDWPVPRTQEELHSFLGLTGYVQRFCPEYASLTASMFTLLKKKNKRNAKIHFSDEQLKNFKELKRRLCNPPVLHLPDFSRSMHLRTDASKFAVGGVLFQVVDGVERPIAYTSRKMKAAELNYPTQQQELLAIVHALAAFRIYCLDKPPIVETDHKSLEGLFTQKMANRRLARWSFDDTSFSLAISEVTGDSELVARIKKSYKRDRDAQAILTAIKRRKSDLRPKREQQQHKKYRCYSEANGLHWYQTPVDDAPRIVVPNDVKLRQTIISECHDTNYGGHPGAERTYLTLARHWYWSKMLKSIQRFIADCEPCQRNKPRLTKPPGLLEPLGIPDERWRSISMDFITDLPRTKRDVDSIWVVVDRLTKRCHFVPTTKKVNAEGGARLFIDNIWKLHGMPTNIVSDRDRKFVSAFW
ncbi:Retrovirus Polyprotein [Phytophthora cinnamomi]|uniref:Retrovirus Polyprotein n=1 Tax=Phytophthora cinnamomi TaxID=4785 RepID=UPI00355981C6|nr:Retrovirus Polyprotein [Phytophthora cinnamomi]